LEGNIVINLHDLGLGNGSLGIPPKVHTNKEKIDKFNFIKN
jgi:hypothetical protein